MQPKAITRYNLAQLILQGLIVLVLILSVAGSVKLIWLVLAIALSQILAVIEVISAAKGSTGSTLAASSIQVGARIAVSGLLFFFLPVGPHWIVMLLGVAWAGADTLRYLYYLQKTNRVWAWLRYSGFIVLYPMGMTLENMIVWRLMQHYLSEPLWFFLPFLSIYLVFALKMYRYMMGQRRRFSSREGRADPLAG